LRLYGSSFLLAPGGGLTVPVDGSTLDVAKIFELDHLNNPIFDAISGVNLTLTFNFLDDDNNPFNVVSSVIPITIEETSNTDTLAGCTSGFQQSTIPCDDRITLTQPTVQLFPVDTPKGDEFLVLNLQFPSSGLNSIVTQEGGDNVFDINGSFTIAPAPLPFGAAGALTLFAGGFKRLRKRYATITSDPA
jgi:hypothetical protein